MRILDLKRLAGALLLFSLFLMPAAAFADGFSVLEWSAAGVAMGEAYMFSENDPSILAYNPARMTKINGRMFSAGATYINPRGETTFHGGPSNGQTWSNTEAPAYVPHLFYVDKINDKFTWGLGVFTRFGNSSQFDENFPGKYDSYEAKITSMSAQPTIAWQATPKLSLALGADIMYMKLEAKKKLPTSILAMQAGIPGIPDADFGLEGDGWGYGWNIGLNYDFNDRTSFAAVYRSKVDMELKGDADLTFPGVSTGGGGEVTLPDSVTVGIGHKFNDRTRIEFGATYTRWSTYDNLTINFDSSILPAPFPPTMQTVSIKDWKDVWRYQIGVEHQMNERWSIMFGYAYDNNPMPDQYMDYMVPTGDRQTASFGFKYRNNNSEWVLGYGYMWISDRTINGHGYDFVYSDTLGNDAHIISLSYNLRLK